MVSIASRILDVIIKVRGIKKMFSDTSTLEARLAGARKAPQPRPRAKLAKTFDISEDHSRGYPVFTVMVPKGGGEMARRISFTSTGAATSGTQRPSTSIWSHGSVKRPGRLVVLPSHRGRIILADPVKVGQSFSRLRPKPKRQK